MAQDFEVLQFNKGDYKDMNGNYWCDMVLKDIGEPVRIVVKDPTQFSSGMTLYGHIEDKVGQSGKPYQRFYREKKDEGFTPSASGKKEWQPRDDASIKAQFAIKTAVALVSSQTGVATIPAIENWAKEFYTMVDRVKGSSESTDPKGLSQTNNSTVSSMSNTPTQSVQISGNPSGYEKAKAVAAALPKSEPEFDPSDEPIDLKDIPF